MASTSTTQDASASKSNDSDAKAATPAKGGKVDATDRVVIGVDDDLKAKLKEASPGVYVAESEIVEEFTFPGTTRPAYRIIAHAGETLNDASIESRRFNRDLTSKEA